MKYNHIKTNSCLSRATNATPYDWNLNIYRGCEHACCYCYAKYTSKNHSNKIYIIDNILELLEKKLRSKSWNKEVINLGNITDSYQPIEKKEKVMPEILKLLYQYQTPCTISTKSSLILRDFDLLEKLSSVAYVNIAVSISTCDEQMRALLEPFASTISERLDVIDAFAKTKVNTGIHIMPVIPLLTDNVNNLENIFYKGNENNVDYISYYILNLIGGTKIEFLDFIRKNFFHLHKQMCALYVDKNPPPAYSSSKNFDFLYSKYLISHESLLQKKTIAEQVYQQLSLFSD